MKNKLTLLTATLLLSVMVVAQAPQKINYQAIARNLAGAPLVNSPVSVLFEIRLGSPTGTVSYSEMHASAMTNQFGLFNLEIGGGTPVSGTFSGINWSTGLYYLYIEVNGNPMLPPTQLLSVPYALHANTATSGTPGANGHNGLTAITAEPPGANCSNGGYLVDVGADDNDDGTLQALEIDLSYYVCNGLDGASNSNDTSATNEIQALSISNDTIFLSNGGFVVLPPAAGDNWGSQVVIVDGVTIFGDGVGTPLSGFDGDYNSLTNQPTIPVNVSQLTNDAGYITNPNDADFDPTNEIELPATATLNQVLTWNGSAWVAQNASSGADNWGSQVVITDATLSGDGTAGNPLSGFDGNYSSLTGAPTNVSSFTNDAGYITNPNDADFDPTNEIELPATATTNEVLTWNGSAWVAQAPTANTDNQDLSLTGNTLSLTNDATPVDLTPYLDNTDAQTLTYNSGTQNLSIANGNSVTLVVDDADNDPTNEYNTAFAVNGANLELSDGFGVLSVPLSSLSDGDWTVAGNDLVTTSTAANVGIGVFSGAPNLLGLTTNALTISSSAAYQFGKSASLELVGSSNVAGSTMGQIDFIGIGAGPTVNNIARIEGEGTGGPTSGELVFFTNSGIGLSEKMRLDGSGFLGIGTNNPSQKLHLFNGTFRISDATDIFDVSLTGTQTQFTLSNPIAIAPNGAGVKFIMDDGNADFFVQVSIQDGTQGLNRVLTSDAVGYGTWTDLSAVFPGATAWTKTGTSIYPTVLSDNVGIGTSSPVVPLDVYTNTSGRAGQFVQDFSSSSTKYGIYGLAQGVGTGTNYGVSGEAVSGAVNVGVRGRGFGGAGNYSGYFDLGDFYVADNVGIGTATPSYKLHVEGNTYINGVTQIGGVSALAAQFKVVNTAGYNLAMLVNGSASSGLLTVGNNGIVTIGNTVTSVSKVLVQDNVATTGGSAGTFLNLQNLSNTTGTTSGIRFRTGGSTAINGDFHYKGAIFFEDGTGSSGEGDMIFAVNGAASSANVTTADAVMTIADYGNIGIATAPSPSVNLYNVSPDDIYSMYGQTNYSYTNTTYGIYARANNGNATGEAIGVYGRADASGTYAYGVYGISAGTATTRYGVYCSGNGGYTGTWLNVSDGKFKENVRPFSNALEGVMKLEAKEYTYTKSPEYAHMNFAQGNQIGFIAQEVEKVFPTLVEDGAHPGKMDEETGEIGEPITYKGMNYIGLIPVLTKAIQEQQKMIEDLKKEVEELKNK